MPEVLTKSNKEVMCHTTEKLTNISFFAAMSHAFSSISVISRETLRTGSWNF